MNLHCYASIREITGKEVHDITPAPKNISELREFLTAKWPLLKDATFVISINRIIVNDLDHPITENDEVALLPPFSGG
jgi:molybdopterin converting factor small subunit